MGMMVVNNILAVLKGEPLINLVSQKGLRTGNEQQTVAKPFGDTLSALKVPEHRA